MQPNFMTRETYYEKHRQARLGNLGTLAMTTSGNLFQWFLTQVYDMRFPHVGDDRHNVRGILKTLRQQQPGRLHASLVQWHRKRGWLNCWHKPLIRLWVEYKAINKL